MPTLNLSKELLSEAPLSKVASKAPLCQAPDPAIRAPRIALPRGSVDCHAHVCGPAEVFPYADQRIYTPPDATLAQYQSLLTMLGIDRAVLVQPSVYGTDNRALMAALADTLASSSTPQQLRGVAVIDSNPEAISDTELERMHQAGVRGIRCNVVDVADTTVGLPLDQLTALAHRIKPFGWHLELLMHVNEYPELDKILAHFPVDLVFGHFGYSHAKHGVTDPGFQGLLNLLRDHKAWVKMTGPYRICDGDFPYTDMRALNDAVINANPQRLVWGSDWPHVMVKKTMPHDADLCDLLGAWVADDTLKNAILVDNPCMLYDFPAVTKQNNSLIS
ncbi:amidohydrolase family protein [Polynucleobacter brandtiae]|uniref:Putative TIM-barrel fold metal-dependent hydrolase n=1 Tax=Polynucleobacter brandtiae TaxID=1938816 RepID=A0A2M8VR28_9BURK|nr:amidohydrolase family protein [Polynucleobacter brandtiae]PJI79911.1 putative TIM-barrel fold metal-dependent hydrolase [Polynucleobacter brandtiae]